MWPNVSWALYRSSTLKVSSSHSSRNYTGGDGDSYARGSARLTGHLEGSRPGAGQAMGTARGGQPGQGSVWGLPFSSSWFLAPHLAFQSFFLS